MDRQNLLRRLSNVPRRFSNFPRRLSNVSQSFFHQRFPSFLKASDKPPPGLSGNQLIGVFFGLLGMLAISLSISMDRWMIEEHLSARSGGILQYSACKGKADNLRPETKKYAKSREDSIILEILNKPVATLAGYKGLWKECILEFENSFHSDGTIHSGEERTVCLGQNCECVNYLKSVHSGNVDPVMITVRAMVLTGLCLIFIGVGAGVYGIYSQV